MTISTFRRYDEAVLSAKVCNDPIIAAGWRHHANTMLETLLDEVVEIEAREERPMAWKEDESSFWDSRPIDKAKWRRRKAKF